MASSNKMQTIRHLFGGGWATDFGPSATVAIQNGIVSLPWLNTAENCIFELDGGPHKCPGTAKINSTALESGATITGAYDHWIQGSGGSPAQHRIVHISTKIKKDDADGSFSDIFTGMTANAIPSYTTFDDFLIIASNLDAPQSWDGTTAQALAGTPPSFSFSEVHKSHLFAAGVDANPSTLYYSAPYDPETWSGGGAGNIQIDPNDGDRITGIKSHRGELLVFKGPYKGSIHRITGSSSSDFASVPHVRGLGAVWHNSIFRFRADIGFMWSDGSLHSLEATSAYGDYNSSSLTLPINSWLASRVNKGSLKQSRAVTWDERGLVLISYPIDSDTVPNIVLALDFRFNPARLAYWSIFDGYCSALALMVDDSDNGRHVPIAGGEDGFLRKLGQPTRSIDGDTAISWEVVSPFLDYGGTFIEKTIESGALGIAPKNDGDITFGWTRDDNAEQTITVNQGGAAVLGSFTLGTDELGGARFNNRYFPTPEGGQFRSISYAARNSVNSEDVELHHIAARLHVDTDSMENA